MKYLSGSRVGVSRHFYKCLDTISSCNCCLYRNMRFPEIPLDQNSGWIRRYELRVGFRIKIFHSMRKVVTGGCFILINSSKNAFIFMQKRPTNIFKFLPPTKIRLNIFRPTFITLKNVLTTEYEERVDGSVRISNSKKGEPMHDLQKWNIDLRSYASFFEKNEWFFLSPRRPCLNIISSLGSERKSLFHIHAFLNLVPKWPPARLEG